MCLAAAGELITIEPHEDPLWRLGAVRFGGVVRQVSLACVPEARVGDHLLVHVGIALAVVAPETVAELGTLTHLAKTAELENGAAGAGATAPGPNPGQQPRPQP